MECAGAEVAAVGMLRNGRRLREEEGFAGNFGWSQAEILELKLASDDETSVRGRPGGLVLFGNGQEVGSGIAGEKKNVVEGRGNDELDGVTIEAGEDGEMLLTKLHGDGVGCRRGGEANGGAAEVDGEILPAEKIEADNGVNMGAEGLREGKINGDDGVVCGANWTKNNLGKEQKTSGDGLAVLAHLSWSGLDGEFSDDLHVHDGDGGAGIDPELEVGEAADAAIDDDHVLANDLKWNLGGAEGFRGQVLLKTGMGQERRGTEKPEKQEETCEGAKKHKNHLHEPRVRRAVRGNLVYLGNRDGNT